MARFTSRLLSVTALLYAGLHACHASQDEEVALGLHNTGNHNKGNKAMRRALWPFLRCGSFLAL
eukprot:35625-Eustigmatos_ZCMA.PRE.1